MTNDDRIDRLTRRKKYIIQGSYRWLITGRGHEAKQWATFSLADQLLQCPGRLPNTCFGRPPAISYISRRVGQMGNTDRHLDALLNLRTREGGYER
jgi:hypothetical protein